MNNLNFGFYTDHNTTQPARLIDMTELLSMVKEPRVGSKETAPCIVPHSGNGKTNEIAEVSTFSYIPIDHDSGNHTKDDIKKLYDNLGVNYLAYTTSSHLMGDTPVNRWRAIIPLASAIGVDQYYKLAQGIAYALNSDSSQGRKAQIAYAPNKLDDNAPYEFIDALGDKWEWLQTDDLEQPFIEKALEGWNKKEFEEQATAILADNKPRPKTITTNDGNGIIEKIADYYSHDITGFIEGHGYKKQGNKYLAPNSASGAAGVRILKRDSKEVLYSHHSAASDALSHENHNEHALDIVDVICVLEHSGDFAAMIKHYAPIVDPEGQKQRQREHMEAKANTNTLAMLDGGNDNAVTPITHELTKRQAKLDAYFNSSTNSYIEVPEAIRQTVIGKLAQRTANVLEMPLGTVLLSLLSGAAAAAATNYTTEFRTGTRVQVGLYVTCEQPPSVQKSLLVNIAIRAYNREIAAHNKRLYGQNTRLGYNALPYAFKHTTDATTAALDADLATRDSGRFFIAASEQGAFQALFPENGSFASNNSLLLNGYIGEHISGLRKSRGSFDGRAMGSVLLVAQKGSVQRVLSESNFTGLAERFLFASEPDNLGKRTFNNGYITDDDTKDYDAAATACVNSFSRRVKVSDQALDAADAIEGDNKKPKPDNESITIETDLDDLVSIKATDEGYDIIRRKKIKLEAFLGELNRAGELTFTGWLGKVETHTLKIAATLHIFDCLGNGCNVAETIPEQTIQNALELVLAIGEHTREIIRDSGEAGDAAEIEAVINAISNSRITASKAALKLRNIKPFKPLGKAAYLVSKARIGQMLKDGLIQIGADGYLKAT